MMRFTVYLCRGLAGVAPQKELRTYDQVDGYESRDDLGVMHGFVVLLSASSELHALWLVLLELRSMPRIKRYDKAAAVEVIVTCRAGLASKFQSILRLTNGYVFESACTFCRRIFNATTC